jgi:cytochrome c5
MAKKEEGYSGSSFWQLMLMIPGVIIGFTLLIAALAYFLNAGSAPAPDAATPAMEEAAAKVEENIKPVAEVVVAQAETEHVEKSGEEVVKSVCSMCHAAGLMEAPKIGDQGQWSPRIAQGYETLVKHAIEGIRNMPAKGGNPALSDNEIAAAVANMANAAGANFDPETLKK